MQLTKTNYVVICVGSHIHPLPSGTFPAHTHPTWIYSSISPLEDEVDAADHCGLYPTSVLVTHFSCWLLKMTCYGNVKHSTRWKSTTLRLKTNYNWLVRAGLRLRCYMPCFPWLRGLLFPPACSLCAKAGQSNLTHFASRSNCSMERSQPHIVLGINSSACK